MDSNLRHLEHLLAPEASLKQTIRQWLHEDIPSFDYGGYVVGSKPEEAILYCKSKGILAGVPFFNCVFELVGCQVEWSRREGELLDPQNHGGRIPIATVQGPACRLLQGERLALNIISRASGIASRARRLREIQKEQQWQGSIAGTRKTTPGFRQVEKYAMLVGGVDGHRMDLSSMIMLKDNHIWSQQGSIAKAVEKARSVGGFSIKIEVECRTYEEAKEAIESGANVVMLDNFNSTDGPKVATRLKQEFVNYPFLIEVSGGLGEQNIGAYMHPSIDILSCGSLSQGVPHIDFSLKVRHPEYQ